jgi:hypothetical protein
MRSFLFGGKCRWRAFGVALTVLVVVAVLQSGAWSGAATAVVVLDLPYGTGAASVGMTAADAETGTPPACPSMFQQTADGALWVLDTVNSRVLAFQNGKQVRAFSTAGEVARPELFGVTRSAAWVVKPAGGLVRYTRETGVPRAVDLALPEDRTLKPLWVRPLGSDESALLLYGSIWPGGQFASVVVDDSGEVQSVRADQEALGHMPASDGTVHRFRVTDGTAPGELAFTLDGYDASAKTWSTKAAGALPRQVEKSAARAQAIPWPVGIDASGNTAIVLHEGRPLSVRFLRLASSGQVVGDVTPEAAGLDPAPLTRYFPSEYYQALPDGSVLAAYASPERYQVVRLTFP